MTRDAEMDAAFAQRVLFTPARPRVESGWMTIATVVLVVATSLYFTAAIVAAARPLSVPFEVFLFGGLILITGWYVHDTVRERMEVGQGADRTV